MEGVADTPAGEALAAQAEQACALRAHVAMLPNLPEALPLEDPMKLQHVSLTLGGRRLLGAASVGCPGCWLPERTVLELPQRCPPPVCADGPPSSFFQLDCILGKMVEDRTIPVREGINEKIDEVRGGGVASGSPALEGAFPASPQAGPAAMRPVLSCAHPSSHAITPCHPPSR